MAFGQPSLGLLIPMIENSVLCLKESERERNSIVATDRSGSDTLFKILIESSLYVIWHHLNLFTSAIELTNEESVAINHLQIKSPDFLNDSLFGAIQSVIKVSFFPTFSFLHIFFHIHLILLSFNRITHSLMLLFEGSIVLLVFKQLHNYSQPRPHLYL